MMADQDYFDRMAKQINDTVDRASKSALTIAVDVCESMAKNPVFARMTGAEALTHAVEVIKAARDRERPDGAN